jgi:hypothetical protein
VEAVKWKVATASVLAAAIVSAPVASAAPGNGNNGGSGARNTIGQTISAIAKSGGGAAGILGALVQLKPNNKGLANALQRVLSHKTTATPTPTPAPTSTPVG